MFTDEDRQQVRHVVQRILVPCVFVIGLLGNSVSIYVLTRKRCFGVSRTTNIYLTALAITDIIYLTMALLLSLKHYDYVQRHCEVYWMYYGIVVWLCDACAYVSIYIAVCFTIERFIAIRYPLKRKTFCTESLAKKVIAGVTLFCILSTISTAFEHQYETYTKVIDIQGRPCNLTALTTVNASTTTATATTTATTTATVASEQLDALNEALVENKWTKLPYAYAGSGDDEVVEHQRHARMMVPSGIADVVMKTKDIANIPNVSAQNLQLLDIVTTTTTATKITRKRTSTPSTSEVDENYEFASLPPPEVDDVEFEFPAEETAETEDENTEAVERLASVLKMQIENLLIERQNETQQEDEDEDVGDDIGMSDDGDVMQLPRCVTFNVTMELCRNVTYFRNSYSALAENPTYTRVWYFFTLFVFVLIPLTVLVTFNSFLIMLVRESKSLRGEMTNESSMRRPKRKCNAPALSQENRVTVTLIAVVLLFIVCQLPWAIYLIVSEHIEIDENLRAIIGNIFNFLAAINAAANFFLYCVLSDKYRKTVRELISGYRYKKQRHTHTTTSLYTHTNPGSMTMNGSRRYRPTGSSVIIK